jgi:hypothetical protein
MTPESCNPDEKIITIKKFMSYFVDDVAKGVSPHEAGWREEEASTSQIDFLLEKDQKRLRLSSNHLSDLHKFVRTNDNDVRRLMEICIDIARSLKVEEYMNNLISKERSSPDLWAAVNVLGLYKMFETSDFPVNPSRVIEWKFNFSNWFVNAFQSSLNLSLEIAKKRYSANWENVTNIVNEITKSTLKTEQPDSNILNRVKGILQWEKVITSICDKNSCTAVEALAYLWFVDYLCEINSLVQDETYSYIQSKAWNLVSTSLGKSTVEIVQAIGRLTDEAYRVSQLNGQVTADWARIIRQPW